ncbi:MAG: SDR family oxidoreductase [Chlorobiota bacterium]|jgi:dTDP-4-dehydrorhamnose reductase|nr:SDR family oxidoreductase [Chlorobiota bacterium]QQS66561.1 MAG: SDR family oxidoreductase [Chlorobiota bacterium]
MKVLIIGSEGLLGQKVVEILKRETNWTIVEVNSKGIFDNGVLEEFDTLSRKDWKLKISNFKEKPTIFINCAAKTNVDVCEDEKNITWKNNVDIVEIIVEICRKLDAKLIQISSDYIFNGKNGPYLEESQPNPINYYGKSKLAAENICIKSGIDFAIIRTMWLYGFSKSGKKDFVCWVLESSKLNKQLKIVDDEFGTPTFIDDIAIGIMKIIEYNYNGIVNITGNKVFSRYELALLIIKKFELSTNLIPIKEQELGRKAKRPLNSGLINFKSQYRLGFNTTDFETGLEIVKNLRKKDEKQFLLRFR